MSTLNRFVLASAMLGTLSGALAARAAAQSAQAAAQTPLVNVQNTAQEKKSLYARLGGYDAIAAVVDDFIGRLVADKQLNKFFVGHSEDSLKKIRMHVIDQICAAAGGPCLYVGRDTKTSHHGLGVTNSDWEVSTKHLAATLDHFKVPQAEKDEVLAFVGTLKKDIVEK